MDTKAVITAPSLESIEIKLDEEAPGQYMGRFRIEDTGAYLIKIVQSKGGEIKSTISTGLSVHYSPEYSMDANGDKLDRLVMESGGQYIEDAGEVFKGPIAPVQGRLDLTLPMLVLALIAFLTDIAIRRLKLPMDEITRLGGLIAKKIKIDKKEQRAEDVREKPDVIPEEKKAKEAKPEENKAASKTLDTAALLKRKKR
ncbi:hypothetical protein SDC9_140363 [bioreactor metagenome]|uniref:Uncharacterized protein n=1 Tax=bioreactor metagenome TaxID=1076179 RepID=A0A645DV16_9ZZZZ